MTDPLEQGKAAAAQIGGGDWQMDAVDVASEAEPEPPAPPVAPPASPPPARPASADPPPSLEQLLEAMLFVGGHPLTAEQARTVIRGLSVERFHEAVDALNRRYRVQRRPYAIEARNGGFVLAVMPRYRSLRDRLFGGPREARLSPAALDVLAAIAYRQPIGKAELDALRGTDSASPLRQLVRLGLIAVRHRGESGSRDVRYGTTPRFLQLFGLTALDELPRLGDTQHV